MAFKIHQHIVNNKHTSDNTNIEDLHISKLKETKKHKNIKILKSMKLGTSHCQKKTQQNISYSKAPTI